MVVSTDTQKIGEAIVAEAERVIATNTYDSYLGTISERGYAIKKEIGENQGATRRAFEATRQVGNLTLEGILKIPREEAEITSLNARINKGKKNLDLQEALINGKLRHPGIARTLDSFQLPDGRTVNFEDKIDGWSLRTFLERAGPVVEKEKLSQMFSQVIDALVYAHEGSYASDTGSWVQKGVLHRDITPNNIIIPSVNGAGGVLTDWQNAILRSEVEAISMPTRGGTGYTHPELLNALVTGDRSLASRTTEVYSLGATLYETVTGEKAFNYNVVEGDIGKEITVNGKPIKVSLKDGQDTVETITPSMHKANLKKAKAKMKAKKVPTKVAELISGMLALEGRDRIYDMQTVQRRFKEATDTTTDTLRKNIPSYIKTALVTAAVGASVGAMACLGIYVANAPQSSHSGPSFSEIMYAQNRTQVMASRGYESLGGIQSGINSPSAFDKYVNEATKKKHLIEGELDRDLEFMFRTSPMDKRMTSALLRSIALEENKEKLAGQERESYSLVPKEYIKLRLGKNNFREGEDNDQFRQQMWMARYIQGCYSLGDSIDEVYVKAMCDRDEIDSAKFETSRGAMINTLHKKGFQGIGGQVIPMGDVVSAYPTNKLTYFSRAETEKRKLFGKEVDQQVYIQGYSEHLNPVKRRIIDRATLFYALTDEDGKLHLENYHQSAKPINGEEAK